MANNDQPFGFRPVRTLSGVYSGAVNPYQVADNYDTNIFTGDIVIPVTGGGVERLQLTMATSLLLLRVVILDLVVLGRKLTSVNWLPRLRIQ